MIQLGKDILEAGAGYAQVRSGNARLRDVGTFFDDPRDTANIRSGISSYNRNHSNSSTAIAGSTNVISRAVLNDLKLALTALSEALNRYSESQSNSN